MTDQMAEVLGRQAEHIRESHRVDRRGWTREQWVADAERLLGDVDGSVLDLLNGHAVHLLAELRALREERDAVPRNTLVEVADRLDAEVVPTQDGCVQFLRDVAEEYPAGRYMRKPEWVTENSELAAEVERLSPPSSWRISGDGYGPEPCLWDCAGGSGAWRILARHDRLPAEVWDWLCRVVPPLEPERE